MDNGGGDNDETVVAMGDVVEAQWKLGMLEDARSSQEELLSCLSTSTPADNVTPPDCPTVSSGAPIPSGGSSLRWR